MPLAVPASLTGRAFVGRDLLIAVPLLRFEARPLFLSGAIGGGLRVGMQPLALLLDGALSLFGALRGQARLAFERLKLGAGPGRRSRGLDADLGLQRGAVDRGGGGRPVHDVHR